MCSILPEFQYTTECEDNYASGFIPTLDMKMRMDADSSISHVFFEKDMASKYRMMLSVPISSNCQNSSLEMDVIRRLKNTG